MKFTGYFAARGISFAIGLLSLATETLWVRTYSFLGQSTPKAVATVLGAYLLGIAFGAMIGGRLCERQQERLPEILVTSILCGSVVILISPLILAMTFNLWPITFFAKIFPASLAFLPAFIFSICFPICHHMGTSREAGSVGKSMSRVYAANIAGSVIGPLLLNFVLLQIATTQLAFTLLGLLGVCVGIGILASFKIQQTKPGVAAYAYASLGLALIGVLVSAGSNNWLIKSLSASKAEIRRIVETRQGVVVSYLDEKRGDIIYGGNVYDGRANVDPHLDSNQIHRLLVLQAFRPNPKKVLVVGLSVGSWLYLINGFPGVEQIDVVEINPGYLDLVQDYQYQSAALKDPRVNLYIGDGRKFLRSGAPGTYDLVVMNTTWHWRAYASLLLSREFLTLVRAHMAPGALLAYNTTQSPDAIYTASSIFQFAYLYDYFAICADFDWRIALDRSASVEEMLKIKPLGTSIFSESDHTLIEDFLSARHTATVSEMAARTGRTLEVITDRNLITEYRYGRKY